VKKQIDKCPQHPRYQGKREPRTMCRGCWRYYVFASLGRAQQKHNDWERL